MEALKANCGFRDTKGATLSVDPETKRFELSQYAALEDLDPDRLVAMVEDFATTLTTVRGKLNGISLGCPSEMATKFALSGIPWSEYSQAKWDMRRMLGDLGHDVESSVFTICDFNHRGREINLKGLLRINWNKEVIAVKRAYYAVQNVVSIFDDTLERVKDSRFGTRDTTLSTSLSVVQECAIL